jgi:hypothetical protein
MTPINVGSGAQYYFQVGSVAGGVASIGISNTATATSTATTSTGCALSSLVVTPSTGKGGGVAVDSSGVLVNQTSFGLAVNTQGDCSTTTVQVGYAPATCIPASSGCTTLYAAMTGTGGTLHGSTLAGTNWAVGTQVFTVFVGATPVPYSPLTQQQVIVCTQNGNSGHC